MAVQNAELAVKHLDVLYSESLVGNHVADKGFIDLVLCSVALVLLRRGNVPYQDSLASVDQDGLALSADVSRLEEETALKQAVWTVYHYRVHSHVVEGIFAHGHALRAQDSNVSVVHSLRSDRHKHHKVVRFHDGSHVAPILSVLHAMDLNVCLDRLVEVGSGLLRNAHQLIACLSDNSLHY